MRKTLLGLLAVLTYGVAAHAWEVSNAPFDDIGLLRSSWKDAEKRKHLLLTDPSSGRSLHSVFSNFGHLESFEEKSASGRILQRREIQGNADIRESFEPFHLRTISRPGKDGIKEVEITRWTQGNAEASILLLGVESTLQACTNPTAPKNADRLLEDLSWINLRPDLTDSTSVPLGNNIRSKGCENYPDGNEGLARDLTQALRTGLKCLADLGPARKMDAARILAFLQPGYCKPAVINCGRPGDASGTAGSGNSIIIQEEETARAFNSDSPDYPAMHLNLNAYTFRSKIRPAIRSTLFHEMMHWLEYNHGEGFDLTYMAQTCCFHQGDLDTLKRARKEACQLLNDNPDWLNENYQARFAKVMALSGRPYLAQKSAWNAIFASPGKDASLLLASLVAAAEQEREVWKGKFMELGTPLFQIALGKAAIARLPKDGQSKSIRLYQEKLIDPTYPSSDPKLAEKAALAKSLGDVISAVIDQDARNFEKTWKIMDGLARKSCALLSDHEKNQLREAAHIAAYQALLIKPSIITRYYDFIDPCLL